MRYNEVGDTGVEVSAVALGGHEYLPGGGMRGFDEDFAAAVEPGVNFEGFGGEQRRAVVETALDRGVTLFDATIDSEKEALGRNLAELDAHDEVRVQTRPAGMCYGYDEYNATMTDYDALRAEVERVLDLLRRDALDFLNLGFQGEALDHDPDFLSKLAANADDLKAAGLIECANCDTFAGPAVYRRAIESGGFDVVNGNFNFADDALSAVFDAAADAGMGVCTREAFCKGALFGMAEEAGVAPDRAAAAAIRWNLSHESVTTVIAGAATAAECANTVEAAESAFDGADEAVLEDLRATDAYETYVGDR